LPFALVFAFFPDYSDKQLTRQWRSPQKFNQQSELNMSTLEKGSDSPERLSDEKATEQPQIALDIPDPDAGLSEEERAAHVHSPSTFVDTHPMLIAKTGQNTSLEAGPQTHPMAFFPLPDFLPRPNEHRKCQNRWSARGSEDDKRAVQCYALHLLRELCAV
jgi:hypothetical protein